MTEPSSKPPLVFISHKHADRKIAKVLADFIVEEARGEVDVHNSSDPNYIGPTTGERLTDALRETLWSTDVLLLLYTAVDQDWSFCMWEAGVATDSKSPHTRTVVLQCGDEGPPPFQGYVRVDLRNRDDVRKFVMEFFLDAGYFPNRGRGLTPRWKKESVALAADRLHLELSGVIESSISSFSNLWPTVLLRIDGAVSQAVRSDPTDRAACRASLSSGSKISSWSESAPGLFGVEELSDLSLNDLVRHWSRATGATDTEWHTSCCEQVLDVLLGVPPVVRAEELQKPDSETTFTPALTRWRKRDEPEFELQFVDLSNPRGIAVEDRMLQTGKIRSRGLDVASQILLRDLSGEMQSSDFNRLPIVDQSGCVRFVVHKSIIDGCLVSRLGEVESLTLEHLVATDAYLPLIRAIAFVPRTATMAEARRAMVAVPHCQDVFITSTGRASEPILGWLTNTDFRRSNT